MPTGLEGKPWWVGALVGVGLGAAIVGAGYYFVNKGQLETIRQREAHLGELQVKIQEGRAAKEKLPQFREEVRRLELELDKLLRILPSRRNTPDLLRRIRALTEQGDFNLLRFTPGNISDRDFYSEWPIAISLTGTYHNLALFYDRISRFSRIINVENLSIGARPPGSPHTINANFIAKTFIYKEAPPPPPPAPSATATEGVR